MILFSAVRCASFRSAAFRFRQPSRGSFRTTNYGHRSSGIIAKFIFFMAKSLPQITFLFDEGGDGPREFLSGAPVPAAVPRPKSTRGRKSLKDADAAYTPPEVPEDEVLFRKQYYSIGEVATMFKVNNSLIRYWENEFDILEPRKNRKGDRLFKPADIRNLEIIYDLLRRRKFTCMTQ